MSSKQATPANGALLRPVHDIARSISYAPGVRLAFRMAVKAGLQNRSTTSPAAKLSQGVLPRSDIRLRPNSLGFHAKRASRLRQQQRPLIAGQLPRELHRANYLVVSSAGYNGTSSEHARIKVIGVGEPLRCLQPNHRCFARNRLLLSCCTGMLQVAVVATRSLACWRRACRYPANA